MEEEKRAILQVKIQILWREMASVHTFGSFEMAAMYVFLPREKNMTNQA